MWNWARNFEYSAVRVHRPQRVEQVQEIVLASGSVKALGTRHSFSAIADCGGDHISTERLNRVVALDRAKRTVTVEAGIRYGELCRYLDDAGFALHNLASLPHISVAGACATATHGSGVGNGNMATAVAGLRFVAADGSIVSLSREDQGDFFGAVVGLGAIGIVTELTLDVEPAYEMSQRVYEDLPFAELETHFEEIMSCGYSVSLFTGWNGPTVDQVWVKARVDNPSIYAFDRSLFGAQAAVAKRSPLPDGPPENCTEQLGTPGPWCDRLPHFRLGFTPSSGDELQTEYFVRREYAWDALRSLYGLREQIAPLLHITEVRTIAADRFWMSPCSADSVAIHFTWKKDPIRISALLPIIETTLSQFEGRPHWGKLFTLPPTHLRELYPRLGDFRVLAAKYDPEGKFRNPWLDRLFGDAATEIS